ncbi:sugar phosphate nucleotidyltransferase [Gemmatimonas sp.]|jgi:mannose-1-phosphate guanylyltransferase|uniref:mannose-1-phosphate guanylyltransferase n=1 Tax=Gemmatimonas sp. TaxID=1962908 RepID=UPI0022C35976|nr:sugar phosphate nucleotidyltransferase [Gemmatimonas sp.]MCA2984253.1 mannose-1-phosphate guanylyltransferase [Gemmatimonas sp.]MCA2986374.1 mannose-1-phosphate guanylyltransferase [Gemmatimonas sp.]MCA2990787.1 mannose-1-phosphate guanylyltransferase [Gemmatimonas sp.]MCA2995002.1 mannose-1-phosphate guanylyltransferase [Gemmatimonas sp.]MCE2954996.1 NTP transferase domain-containing protein [Gemmatimonas sp.]
MSETRVVSPTAPTSVTNDDALAAGTLEEVDLEAMLGTGTAMWAVVFAGGIGTRFWPLSTPRRPKQVLALVNERPLIADTVARLAPLVPAERVLVVTSADIADALHEAIPEVPRSNLLIEPRPLGTAAALAWGAQEVSRRAGPDTVFVALHADLAVGYPDVLRDTLRRAAAIASADNALVALGARPTRAETGFGYLQPGMPLDPLQSRAEGGACRVEHFVEKPGAALADVLIERGALWNTGIFVWRARVVLDELDRHTAEVRHGLPQLAAGAMEQFAARVSSVSIDRGLLERSPNVVVLPADMEWDDVGTWASLRRVRELDDTGNGVMGQVHCVDCSGNVIHADGCCVVAYGISGMIVVSIDGLTFVTTQDRATELGPLLNALPGSLRFNPGRQ